MESLSGVTGDRFEGLIQQVNDHFNDTNNPHHVTAGQIAAIDRDKPISKATQEALDEIMTLVKAIQDSASGGIDITGLKYFTDARYDQSSGNLMLFYNDGKYINVNIPTSELVADIRYEEDTHRIVFTRLSGSKRYLDLENLSDLVIKYNGSEGDSINIIVDSIEGSDDKVIRASIVPKGVTREMLADDAITADLIPSQAITGDKLFRGKRDYTVLATMREGEDPRWSRIVGGMIEDEAIEEQHLGESSVGTAKLKDLAVTTEKLKDLSVTEEKLADGAVTNDKVADGSISGSKLAWNPEFIGTPTITKSPRADSDGSEVPDTQWVRERIDKTIIDRNHLADESVGPSKLFRATKHNTVLITRRTSSDPEWGKINHEMLEDDSVGTNNLKNLGVTSEKLADEVIIPRHLTKDLISQYNLQEGSVTSEKIWASHSPNMILGVHNANDHPFYTKVNQEMLEQNAVGTLQIQDRSVTLSKLESAKENNRVLTVSLWNTDPKWTQINSKMIEDRAILSRHLFTSKQENMILGVREAESDPAWMKISGEMLEDDSVQTSHIRDESITGEKIAKDSINSDHIQEKSILAKHLGDKIIEPSHLFSSDEPGVVLAVKGEPNSDPVWSKITGDMIEDLSITPEKMYRSEDPYRVLGVKDPTCPPEYLRITQEFIEDSSIGSSKLAEDLVLRGDVRLANHPAYTSNSYAVPTTQWVRRLVTDSLGDLSDVTAKIPKDALLPGSPRIEVRPPADASDMEYNGNMIPDCQWVMDRIKEWYDKITEMDPDVPEDVWEELIPECRPGCCGPCVLEELTELDVEDSWENDGAEPDQEKPADPWDVYCSAEQITNDIVERIWDTDKITEDLALELQWPSFTMQGSDGLLRIEVDDDYVGPGFRIDHGKLRATGDDDIVDNLRIVDGKLLFDFSEVIIGSTFSIDPTTQVLSVESPDNPNEPSFHLKDSDLIADGEEDIIRRLSITDDQIFLNSKASDSSTKYPRFFVDQVPENLLVELPDGYTGPTFSMEDGCLYADGEEKEVNKYSLSDGSIIVDTSTDQWECKCDIEEVTEDWVKEVWDDEWWKSQCGGDCGCSGGTVTDGSITAIKIATGAVTTPKLADRAVTGAKLFTSKKDHMVLGVKEAGTDPEYLKITREMLDDSRLIDGSKLFSSYTPNRILAVLSSGGDPQWVKIKNEFLDDGIIENRNLADESITGRKIRDRSIGANKLADEAMIYPVHLTDKVVTEDKIDVDAVRTEHIQKGAITGEKIAKDIVIPAYPTVESHTDYERRSLRNTILSPNAPKGGQNGDIWFRYI